MQLHYIANTAQRSTSGRTIPVIDPSDGTESGNIGHLNPKGLTAKH